MRAGRASASLASLDGVRNPLMASLASLDGRRWSGGERQRGVLGRSGGGMREMGELHVYDRNGSFYRRWLNLPLSAIAGNLNRTALSALFSKVVPKEDVGAALSVLDVLNSAVGIISPLYGGLLLGRLGVEYQPLISCIHYLLLLVAVTALVGRHVPGELEGKSKSE